MTHTTSSMVMEVSATLVDSTTLTRPGGGRWNTLRWSSGGSPPCRGSTQAGSSMGPVEEPPSTSPRAAAAVAAATRASRTLSISLVPGRNTRMAVPSPPGTSSSAFASSSPASLSSSSAAAALDFFFFFLSSLPLESPPPISVLVAMPGSHLSALAPGRAASALSTSPPPPAPPRTNHCTSSTMSCTLTTSVSSCDSARAAVLARTWLGQLRDRRFTHSTSEGGRRDSSAAAALPARRWCA
mmetsp:Transcript_36614/g.90381  ORF Transcript_36614/g.90381 Transcript_36614/m.90381 type:complete len:241 (+) Transcript_36614:910-1632(+)